MPCLGLAAFEETIAAGAPADENALLQASAELLFDRSIENNRARFAALLAADAHAEAAMFAYRSVLPEYGFQFGLPPPLPNGRPSSAVATSWRRGDCVSMPYRGSTPALALLRATVSEFARKRDANLLSQCPLCRGIGWIVTDENRRQMCRHE